MSLDEHRNQIDAIDSQMVKLLNERLQHALAIGKIKLEQGGSIYAPHREKAVFDRVCSLNEGPLPDDSLRAIYREIMSAAISLEKPVSIAFFGPEATYTHQAAIRKFGSSLSYQALKTIGDVFTEVSKGRADYGVVPVENSTEGVVTHTLDMFVDSELKIVAQIVMKIQHCLLARCDRSAIRKLYTHPQPMGQCRQWLHTQMPEVEIIETSSTTRAAEMAAEEEGAAAIAGALAAEHYQLNILESDIQDNAANATRFLVLGKQCSPATGQDRTSLMLSIDHSVGALHRAIAPFQSLKLNMTKIESRPSKRKAWEYFFFIDVDGHVEDTQVAEAIQLLESECNSVKVLGSYPRSE
ncbi:MAG: prephenate dehydratase [Verrucomicrobiales bacterium]